MHEPKTWRELLHGLIEDAQDRQRIAALSGINSITLQRWANNERNPRVRNLHQLISALPDHSAQLIPLIQKEYPTFLENTTSSIIDEDLSKIPSRFYTSVLRAYTRTSPSLRFWSISKLILQQALQHLDPQRLGLLLTITGCTAPHTASKRVRSLRILLGQGSSPWEGTWDRYPLFMGLESLCGYVVSNRRLISIQDTEKLDNLYYPMIPVKHARSIAVAPIQRAESIAGAFYISSTQPSYFTPERLELFQSYSQLLTVAFTPSEFYPASYIDLTLFPTLEQQEPYFQTFQQRLLDTMRASILQGQPLNSQEATQQVMSQLEEELILLSYKRQ